MRPNLVLLVAFAALGCGRIREVKECRTLARLMNPTLDQISERLGKDQSPAAYRFAATRYEKLSTELRQFRLGIPRAQKTLGELATTMNDAHLHSTRLADALDRSDIVLAGNARRDLGNLARQQKAITMRLHGDCSGH
jgi:hypothetical protein